MREKIKLSCPVAVEGRYDKQRVLSVAEGTVIQLDGFSVFNNKEKQALLRRLCGSGKIILLTDSDSAGAFIRAKLKGYLPAEKIINVYAPRIEGKEKRKKTLWLKLYNRPNQINRSKFCYYTGIKSKHFHQRER